NRSRVVGMLTVPDGALASLVLGDQLQKLVGAVDLVTHHATSATSASSIRTAAMSSSVARSASSAHSHARRSAPKASDRRTNGIGLYVYAGGDDAGIRRCLHVHGSRQPQSSGGSRQAASRRRRRPTRVS